MGECVSEKDERANRSQLLGLVSDNALKHLLRSRGLPHTAQNRGQLEKRLESLLDSQRLSILELQDEIRGIEEVGGKRMYLRSLSGYEQLRDQSHVAARLSEHGMKLSDRPGNLIALPEKPTLNYAVWSQEELRLRFSETHRNVQVNYTEGTLEYQPINRIAIVAVDLRAGVARVMLDPPGVLNPHSAGAVHGAEAEAAYVQYYLSLPKTLLGCSTAHLLDLSGVTRKLIEDPDQPFRVPKQKLRTSQNSLIACANARDIRDDHAIRALLADDGRDCYYQNSMGFWSAEASNGELLRDVFTELHAPNCMVRFLADCLPSEVDYALRRIARTVPKAPAAHG